MKTPESLYIRQDSNGGIERTSEFDNQHEVYIKAAILAELMPFVLEDYWPACATPGFKHAVERAKSVLPPNDTDDSRKTTGE